MVTLPQNRLPVTPPAEGATLLGRGGLGRGRGQRSPSREPGRRRSERSVPIESGPRAARASAGEGPPLLHRPPHSAPTLPEPQPGPTGSRAPASRPRPTRTPGAPRRRPSPPPRPTPRPDSPREYRDLGDSRSRSALSNEMKSEGIAARPSPARRQRGGGSGGGGGTSSPDRGHRTGGGEGGRPLPPPRGQLTSTGPRTDETAAGRRETPRGLTPGEPGERFGAGKGRGENQRIRFVLLLSEN